MAFKDKPIVRISSRLASREPDPAFVKHFGRGRTPINSGEIEKMGTKINGKPKKA